MDDQPNNQRQRHQRHHGWRKFTFFGETQTPEKQDKDGNRAKFAPELTQNKSRMKQVFALSNTQVGEHVVITQILNGKGMIYRLGQMGLTLGSEVEVISQTKSGSIIIGFQDQQIGLGVGMANKIMVTFATEKS
ncbi:MAG: FeoA family protein [Mastigocoleus sp. MO_167.B18]|nr:FeoA family protein [Mastigocoleus sp. MO_167.B18]